MEHKCAFVCKSAATPDSWEGRVQCFLHDWHNVLGALCNACHVAGDQIVPRCIVPCCGAHGFNHANRSQGVHNSISTCPHQIGSDQPDSAVDVKSHPPWRDHRLRVVHVKCRHIADGKPISRVHIREGNGSLWGLTRKVTLQKSGWPNVTRVESFTARKKGRRYKNAGGCATASPVQRRGLTSLVVYAWRRGLQRTASPPACVVSHATGQPGGGRCRPHRRGFGGAAVVNPAPSSASDEVVMELDALL